MAFFRNTPKRRAYVLRDCSGKWPCFRARHDEVDIVFSDIRDLRLLQVPKFGFNYRYLAAFIYSSQLQIRDTGLEQVSEVLAGERVELGGAIPVHTVLWDPGCIARSSQEERDYESAITKVQRVTQYCVDSWAASFDSVVHLLSGGLDSAIVLGCLRKSPHIPKLVCVNRFSEHGREDERCYARMAAEQAGVTLIEQPWFSTQRNLDSNVFHLPPTAKPYIPLIMKSLDLELINLVATQAKAQAAWTGEGGDHLFWQPHNSLPAADFVADRGVRFGLASAIDDAARLASEPYWFVLQSALRTARSRARWYPESAATRTAHFVKPEALPDRPLEYVSHPWTAGCTDLPKGKQFQIYFLADVLHRQRQIPDLEHVIEHHPLLSQPLIELCLQIPTYLLIKGGRQRALARDAFRTYVPAPIIAREVKGETTLSIIDKIRNSESFLRELLLDGTLGTRGRRRKKDA